MIRSIFTILIMVFAVKVFAFPVDLSEKFHTTAGKVQALEPLRKYKVLMVRGFLSDYFEFIDKNYQDQVSLLEENFFQAGSDFEIVNTDTEANPEINAMDIVKAIRDSRKPVFLVSHSKGSVDVLFALLTYPELQKKVKGWVSLQGAIKGSVVADNATSSEFSGYSKEQIRKHPIRSISRFVLDLMVRFSSGKSDVLKTLRTDVREKFLKDRDQEIRGLTKNVNILSVGSWQKYEDLGFIMQKQIDIMAPKAPLSDGLIEPMRAIVPYSPYLILPNVHHKDLVPSRSPFDRQTFTLKILENFWSFYGEG